MPLLVAEITLEEVSPVVETFESVKGNPPYTL
jgi:hypothetical protein